MALAKYLRIKYPTVIFHFDYGSGLRMTISQAARQKRLNNRAFPDLFLAQPMPMPGKTEEPRNWYSGLFLELKRDGTRIKKKDGSYASPHLEEQAAVLDQLAEAGYIAQFAVGFDQATELIDSYMEAA